jgi:hypothetical protein
MRYAYRLLLACFIPLPALAQTGGVRIGTAGAPDAAAALDISATGKGLLIPRMDSVTRVGIGTPPDGLMVFQTDGRKGFWYAMSSTWLYIPDKTKSGDNLGSHTATQNLNLGANQLVGNGGSVGLRISSTGNVGIGPDAPRGKFDVNGGGDAYLVDNPSSGSRQSVYLPGHLFLAPYSGTSGTAYVQARVPGATPSTSIGLNLRTTNAGNFVEALQLSASGEARFIGRATATEFAYPTPQTHYLTIGSTGFVPQDGTAYQAYTGMGTSSGTPFDTSLLHGTAGQPGYLVAPVNLPQGAVITSLQFTAVDRDGTSVSPQVLLTATAPTTGGLTTVLLISKELTTESPDWQTASVPVNHAVNNDSYQYQLRVRLNQDSLLTSLLNVRIAYTVSQAD